MDGPELIAEAKRIATHAHAGQYDKAGAPYVGHPARVAANSIALTVKRSDIADNADPARLAALDDETRMRLATKYDHAGAALATFGLARNPRSGQRGLDRTDGSP